MTAIRTRTDVAPKKTIIVCNGLGCEKTIVRGTTGEAEAMVNDWEFVGRPRQFRDYQYGVHFCSKKCVDSLNGDWYGN